MKQLIAAVLLTMCFSVFAAADAVTIDLTKEQAARETVTVTLRGKIQHFGKAYKYTVPGVRVWLSEYPATRDMGVMSDDAGWWEMKVTKLQGIPLHASFVYEKEGWPTTKTNVYSITDEDDTDIAIQFIDPELYYDEVKPGVAQIMTLYGKKGDASKMRNAMVATVGKQWASMQLDRFPHGDPGATCTKVKGAAGPIYFDESVRPNPAYGATSVDGGVAWINVPPGTHTVTAKKAGVVYPEITFEITKSDREAGVELYISSPPDSINGNNTSGPGSAEIVTGGAPEAVDGEDPLAVARAVMQTQVEALVAGDIAAFREHFTPRLRNAFTQEDMDAAREEVSMYALEDLVESAHPGEYMGQDTIKIMMSNGRTLTTLVRSGDTWLADTIWFR